jgi:hypothetical protein
MNLGIYGIFYVVKFRCCEFLNKIHLDERITKLENNGIFEIKNKSSVTIVISEHLPENGQNM